MHSLHLCFICVFLWWGRGKVIVFYFKSYSVFVLLVFDTDYWDWKTRKPGKRRNLEKYRQERRNEGKWRGMHWEAEVNKSVMDTSIWIWIIKTFPFLLFSKIFPNFLLNEYIQPLNFRSYQGEELRLISSCSWCLSRTVRSLITVYLVNCFLQVCDVV